MRWIAAAEDKVTALEFRTQSAEAQLHEAKRALLLVEEAIREPDSCTAAKQGPLLTRASSAQLASECCVAPGDSGREAYRAMAHGSEDSSPGSRGGPTS